MGQEMARRLLKARYLLLVYNRTREKSEKLKDEGAEVANYVSGACAADVVITMLADDTAVEQVVFQKDGIIDALSSRGTHISMSTISPALADRFKKSSQRKEASFYFGASSWASGSRCRREAPRVSRRATRRTREVSTGFGQK